MSDVTPLKPVNLLETFEDELNYANLAAVFKEDVSHHLWVKTVGGNWVYEGTGLVEILDSHNLSKLHGVIIFEGVSYR